MESLRSPFLSSPLQFSLSPSNSTSSFPVRRPSASPKRVLAVNSSSSSSKTKPLTPVDLAKNSLSFLIFSLSISFLPFPSLKPPIAAAVPAATTSSRKEHEFSNYTDELLSLVRLLLDKVNAGSVADARAALKGVKAKRKEIQGKILEKLNLELKELRREKDELMKKANELVEKAVDAKKDIDVILRNKGEVSEEAKVKVKRLESVIENADREYSGLCERIGEIEDITMRREALVYSVAIREIAFIERESEVLVDRFSRTQRQGKSESKQTSSSKLPKDYIQKELEAAKEEYWKQKLLPKALEDEDDFFSDTSTQTFAAKIGKVLEESEQMQTNLEADIRNKLKKYGEENRFLVSTPKEEVLKGFPDVEMKWVFGKREVVVPKAASLHLYHGWKKWREEAKANLKKDLLQDTEHGRQYMAQILERLLLDRERIMTKTWYNDDKNRWEMDPVAVPYAVSRKLVECAGIRHDWAVMYVSLKGDDKEYYVDIKILEVSMDYIQKCWHLVFQP